MPHHPVPTSAPYDLASDRAGWLHDAAGHPYPIVSRTRRRVVIDTFGTRVVLKRRALESTGAATGQDGTAYYVTSYQPHEGETP